MPGTGSGDVAAVTVESDAALWTEDAAWRVDTVPALAVGLQNGPEDYQFYRLTDALRLEDGTLVASNAGSGELRFYGADGRFIKAVGGRGGGPGEFAEFSGLRSCRTADGRLLVDDTGQDRVNAFTTSGEYLATIRLGPTGGGRPPQVVGCLADGRLVGISWPDGGVLRGEAGTVIRGQLDYVVIDTAGQVAATLAHVASQPRYVNQVGNITHYPFIPFAPEPAIAVGSNRVYVLSGGAARVEQRDPAGSVLAVFAWHGAPRARVAAVWDRYVKESLAEIGDDEYRRRYARFYAQALPLPDSTPAVQALLVDAAGYLWAERYRLPWDHENRWDVLDPEGRWLGTVALPGPLTVFEIGTDYVLGRHADDLGVERLVRYRLDRH